MPLILGSFWLCGEEFDTGLEASCNSDPGGGVEDKEAVGWELVEGVACGAVVLLEAAAGCEVEDGAGVGEGTEAAGVEGAGVAIGGGPPMTLLTPPAMYS